MSPGASLVLERFTKPPRSAYRSPRKVKQSAAVRCSDAGDVEPSVITRANLSGGHYAHVTRVHRSFKHGG
jgi:hypothetical protein